MADKIKILWISHGSNLNGAERVLFEGVKALGELGYEVCAIFPSQGPLIPLCKEYIDNIQIINMPWWIDIGEKLTLSSKIKLLLRVIRSTFKISKIVQKINPNIIITNTIAIPCGALAAFYLRRKHIWYIHEFGKEDHNFNFIFGTWLSSKLISFLSKRVIVNSLIVNEKYNKYINTKKLKVIYCAVDMAYSDLEIYPSSRFSESNPLKTIIYGRVSPSKGQMEAIKAIEYLVLREKYFIILTIIGTGSDSYSNEIRNYIIINKLQNFIKIIDFLPDPLILVSHNDICLNCSVKEAFGRITVEAMKLGKPVIGSNTGGNLELIDNFKNGMLYNQGDYLSLSEKIEFFYLNPHEIENFGKYAHQWANGKFNLKNYQNELDLIISEIQ